MPRSVALWLQVVEGRLQVLDETLAEGDGLGIEAADRLDIRALEASHYLLYRFDTRRSS